MSTPIQGDKPMTLNNERGQSTHSNGRSGSGTASSSSSAPIEAPQASTEVDIERGSQAYSSATQQISASSEATIASTTGAISTLDQLKEQLTGSPSQAMQAQGHVSTSQVAALLHAA